MHALYTLPKTEIKYNKADGRYVIAFGEIQKAIFVLFKKREQNYWFKTNPDHSFPFKELTKLIVPI